jgi:predicted nuclease with TOPRIM domain
MDVKKAKGMIKSFINDKIRDTSFCRDEIQDLVNDFIDEIMKELEETHEVEIEKLVHETNDLKEEVIEAEGRAYDREEEIDLGMTSLSHVHGLEAMCLFKKAGVPLSLMPGPNEVKISDFLEAFKWVIDHS